MLKVTDLNVQFRQPGRSVHALRGCSLTAHKGEILGLVGESGCGKSLTALACLGLVPEPGDVSGSIEIAGRQIVDRPDAELEDIRGGTAAMIFQNPMAAMNPFFTIGRQITDTVRCHLPFSGKEAKQVALRTLASIHVPDPELVLEKYPHQLSGGQLQRVMIAMAVACEPKLLIADEPTTALDVTVQAQVIVLIRELARETGLTILFITHDLGVVATLCDRVAVMYAGQVVESGRIEQIFETPGHPYTEKLMKTAPSLGTRKSELDYIPGRVPDMALPIGGCAFEPRCDKATDVCRRTAPTIRSTADGQRIACHHVSEILKTDEARPAD